MIEQALLSDLFTWDLEAGKLFWRTPPKRHPRLLNQEAGGSRVNHGGKFYWVIKIEGKAHKRGRLIFFIANGRWPHPCVDHINGDSLDDRIKNLREATITQNAWNHSKRAKQSDLPMGVRLIKASGKYQARIAVNKRMIHLGVFSCPSSASATYQAARKEHYGEYA